MLNLACPFAVHMHILMHILALAHSQGKRKTMKEQQTDPLTVFGSLEASVHFWCPASGCCSLCPCLSLLKSLRSENKMLVMDAIVHSADVSSPLGVLHGKTTHHSRTPRRIGHCIQWHPVHWRKKVLLNILRYLNYFELFWTRLNCIRFLWLEENLRGQILLENGLLRKLGLTDAWMSSLPKVTRTGAEHMPNTSLIIFAHLTPSQSLNPSHKSVSFFIHSLSIFIMLYLFESTYFPDFSSCFFMVSLSPDVELSWRRKLRVFLFNSWTIGRGALDMCKFWYRRHRRPLWRCFDSTTEINGDLLCNHYDLWKFSELHMVLVAACSCGSSLKRQGRGLLRNLC